MRRAVSEFPNDNPELHDGLVWSAPSPCARPLPTLRLRPIVGAAPRVMGPSWAEAASEPASGARVAEQVPVAGYVAEGEAVLVAATGPKPEVIPAGPFEQFVAALVRVLLERGATRAAASVRGLFGLERLSAEGWERGALETLFARGILERESLRPAPAFAAVASVWRGVLEGTCIDLSACGSTTLDVWAAQTLAALLNVPRERADELRRELRKRGVAAFGFLAAA